VIGGVFISLNRLTPDKIVGCGWLVPCIPDVATVQQHSAQAERHAPAAALHFCDVPLHRRAPTWALGSGQGNWQYPGLSLSLPTATGFPSSACFANRPHAELGLRM